MLKKMASDGDLKKLKADPILKNINRLYDIMPKVIYDKTETDNHARIFCWLAADCFTKIKKKSVKMHNVISLQFNKYNREFIMSLERDEEYLKAQNLKRFMALLTKKMKW